MNTPVFSNKEEIADVLQPSSQKRQEHVVAQVMDFLVPQIKEETAKARQRIPQGHIQEQS